MNTTYTKSAFGLIAFALMLSITGTVSAQTAPSVGVGQTAPTTVTVVNDSTAGSVSGDVRRVSVPATGATLSTINFTSTQGRTVQVSSIPFSLTLTGGAATSTLSSCQFFNSAGSVLNTGSNVPTNSLGSGTNVITLDTPLVIPAGTTQSVTLRCNVAGNATVGSTFQTIVLPGSTIVSLPASLAVTATAIPAIQNNTVPVGNVTLGTVRLDSSNSGSDIRVSQIPIAVTTALGASAVNVTGCQLFSPAGVALNTGSNVQGSLASSGNSIVLDTPLLVPSNTFTTLTLRCSVNPGVTTGGTFTLTAGSGSPFAVSAFPSGTSVTPSVTTITTAAVPVAGGVVIPPIVPGVPGTGAGTNASTYFALAIATLVVLGAALYVRKAS